MRFGKSRFLRLSALSALSAVVLTTTGAVSGTGAGAEVAGSGHAAHRIASANSARIARIEPVCAQPKPGRASCLALRRVPVAAGTAGARAVRDTAAGAGPSAGYTPDQLATAYGVDNAATTTQTVAIVDAFDDPYARTELNTFDRRYGLPAETATSLRKLTQRGTTSGFPKANASWAAEIALDIQAVRGLCNKCRILLVEAASDTGADLAAAENAAVRFGARIVSNSYGAPESYSTSPIRAAYSHPGVLVTASTGDDGWYGWDYANDTVRTPGTSDNEPDIPAAYPGVVAVGGTALTLAPDGSRSSETVWNQNGPSDAIGMAHFVSAGATGGGCSRRYAAPGRQSELAGYSALGCQGYRSAGDVAAVADPSTGYDIYSTYFGGWNTFGGTSLSAPIIAALAGLSGGTHGIAYPAQTLYDNFRYRSGTTYDVTHGSNAFCGDDDKATCAATVSSLTGAGTANPNNLANGNVVRQGGWAGLLDCGFGYYGGESRLVNDKQCKARAGFDGPSGVGTPNGVDLFRPIRPTVSFALPAVAKLRTAGTFVAHVTQALSSVTVSRYTWHWGDGSQTSSGASASHAYTRAGAYPVTLGVTDSLGQYVTTARTVTVGSALKLTITGQATVRKGTAHKWTAWGSKDPNTGGRIVSYTWWWGDNSPAKSGYYAWHTYAHAGKHTLAMRLTDNTGVVTTAQRTITVTS